MNSYKVEQYFRVRFDSYSDRLQEKLLFLKGMGVKVNTEDNYGNPMDFFRVEMNANQFDRFREEFGSSDDEYQEED